MQGFYVFTKSSCGETVYVARDGGLTEDKGEADVNSEEMANKLADLVVKEYDIAFAVAEMTEG